MKIPTLVFALILAAAANPAAAQSDTAAPEATIAPATPAEADSQDATSEDAAPVVAPPLPVRELGSPDAPVRIDLYMSFACETCSDWYLNVLPALKRDFIDRGQVRLVFHDVATEPAQPSVRSAMIGLCAAPGRFFDVAQAFASGQRAASQDVEMVAPWYDNAIAASGLTAEEMEACSNSEPVYEQVRAQMQDPVVATLTTLPGVVVNDRLLPETSLATTTIAIQGALTQTE